MCARFDSRVKDGGTSGGSCETPREPGWQRRIGVFCARLCFVISLVGIITPVSAQPEGLDLFSLRYPHLSVPRLQKAPDIDGSVNRGEWLGAAQLGPLRVGKSGVADGLRRDVFIGFNDESIFLGFHLERPPGAVKPKMPADGGRLDRTGGGDLIEFMLIPELDFSRGFDFWLFANAAYGDAIIDPKKVRSWNPVWQKAASLTADGWQGEIAIPWRAFDRDGPPSPDEEWALDFVDNRKTPFGLLGHWSLRGNLWHTYENFGRIRFATAPAVQFHKAGDVGGGKLAVAFDILNTTNNDTMVTSRVQLLQRRKGAAGGPKSFFENIESGMAHDLTTEFTKGSDLASQIRFALQYYAPVEDASIDSTAPLAAGQRQTVGFSRPSDVGEYLVTYHFSADGERLYDGAATFRIQPPLALQLEPYWLYSRVIDITADLSRVDIPEDASLKFTIEDKSGIVLDSNSVAVEAGTHSAQGTVSVDGLASGFYKVTAKLLDAAGNEVAGNTEPVQKPVEPDWYRNSFGKETSVPAPWTPLILTDSVCTINGREVSRRTKAETWGRVHTLDDVFPSSIRVDGREILAAPIVCDVVADGKNLDWHVTQLELVDSDESRARYTVRLDSTLAELTGQFSIEYDGFMWYDLEMTPKHAELELEKAELNIRLVPEFAELFGRHKFHGMIPGNRPSAALNGAPGILQHSKFPFTPYVWIGNEKAGISWIAEAPVDWHVTKPNEVLETIPARDGRPAGIRVHMVDAPTTLQKPMRMQFGLQATPIRPLPAHDLGNLVQKRGVFADEELYGELASWGCRGLIYYYGWRGDPRTELGGTPEPPRDPQQIERIKNAVEMAHRHGMKTLTYTGWGVNATSDNWQKFSYELGAYPIQNKGFGTYKQSAGTNGGYGDFMAYGHAMLAKNYGLDGTLWDSTGNLSPDRNRRIGNAWVDGEGRVRKKYAVLATRDLYRRVYNVYKSECNEGGIVYNHGGSMWPINVYADILNRGEGRPQHAQTLRDSWLNMEEFRAEYCGEPFGVLYSGDDNNHKQLPMRVNNHMAVWMLHGYYVKGVKEPRRWTYEKNDKPVAALWLAFDWLPYRNREIRRFLYHQSEKVVLTSENKLLTSAFVNTVTGRAIVHIANLDRISLSNVTVRLLPGRMGLGEGVLQVEDAVLRKPVAVDATDNSFKLDFLPERYRTLKVWGKELRP